MVNVPREGIALHKIPEEKEDGNYEEEKKKKKKWQEILAATAFAEELQNVHESIYFFYAVVAPELPFSIGTKHRYHTQPEAEHQTSLW